MSTILLSDDDFVLNSNTNLYWNKFQYKMTVGLPGISFIRYLKNSSDLYNVNGSKKSFDFYNYEARRQYYISKYLYEYSKFLDLRSEYVDSDKVKFVISYDQVHVYSSDIRILNDIHTELSNFNTIKIELFKSKQTLAEKNTIYRVNTQYNYRAILDTISVHKSYRNELREIWLNNSNEINVSKGFLSFIILNESKYSYYWMDVKDESFLTILMLRFDKLIKKIYKIEKA